MPIGTERVREYHHPRAKVLANEAEALPGDGFFLALHDFGQHSAEWLHLWRCSLAYPVAPSSICSHTLIRP